MGLNKMQLIGRLGADPEVRHTTGGTAVCELNVAISDRRKVRDEWTDHTEWVRCVVFGKRAENVAKFLSKGSQVYVEGKLTTEKWEKDGITRYTTKVIVDDVQFLDGKKDGGSRGGQHSDSLPGQERDYPMDRGGNAQREGLDDDIPF